MIAQTDIAKTPRRRGAQAGNTNAVRHGLRGSQCPPGCQDLDDRLYSLRADIMTELTARTDVTLFAEALVQSCIRHERRALLASRWLRKGFDELTVDQRLALLATISKATDDRDRCLARMGIGPQDSAATYSIPSYEIAQPDASDGPQTSAASETTPESFETVCDREVQP